MKTLALRTQNIYPVRARVLPFVKGIFKGEPLVEVAIEGLKKENLNPKLKEKYEKRIEIATDPELQERSKSLLKSKLWSFASYSLSAIGGYFTISASEPNWIKMTVFLIAGAISARLAYENLSDAFRKLHVDISQRLGSILSFFSGTIFGASFSLINLIDREAQIYFAMDLDNFKEVYNSYYKPVLELFLIIGVAGACYLLVEAINLRLKNPYIWNQLKELKKPQDSKPTE